VNYLNHSFLNIKKLNSTNNNKKGIVELFINKYLFIYYKYVKLVDINRINIIFFIKIQIYYEMIIESI
jgi:hypothetical protein